MARRTEQEICGQAGAIATLVRQKRKSIGYTQPDLAFNTGVGLRFIKELEQGKTTLRMDKVNEVLRFFGYELGPVRKHANS